MRHRTILDAKIATPAAICCGEPISTLATMDYETPDPLRRSGLKTVVLECLVAVACTMAIFAARGFLLGTDRGYSKVGFAHSDLSSLEGAISKFDADVGRYPSTTEGLQVLLTAPPGIVNWHGPYIMHPPLDPWGHMYAYHYSAQTGIEIRCAGPDGKLGTSDDIVNSFNPAKSP
jgi:general secretion pathway protein G